MGILFTRIWRLFNHQGEAGPGGEVPEARLCLPGAGERFLTPYTHCSDWIASAKCVLPPAGPPADGLARSHPVPCRQLCLGRTESIWGSGVSTASPGPGCGPRGATEPSGCRMRKAGTSAGLVVRFGRLTPGGEGKGPGDPRRGTGTGASPLPCLFL